MSLARRKAVYELCVKYGIIILEDNPYGELRFRGEDLPTIKSMYPVLCTVEPGCGNLTPHTHKGEELIFILSGVIEITVNNDPPYILHPGDTFYYRGSDTHSWVNISTKPAKMLWVHSSLSL